MRVRGSRGFRGGRGGGNSGVGGGDFRGGVGVTTHSCSGAIGYVFQTSCSLNHVGRASRLVGAMRLGNMDKVPGRYHWIHTLLAQMAKIYFTSSQ